MVLEFATKRDVSGNRYYLGIDTEKQTFARDRGHWYTRDDVTEIGKADRRKLIEQLENAGFSEVDFLQ